ncbi:MAG: ferredoxin--NADP reductase [Dehalococcoidia bacterium]|nr:ferredoxin--NADP reductase [Dehalococcoidia bacterium]
MKEAPPTATVVARKEVTHDLFILKLAPSIPFTFTPGQYCTIGLDGIERPYSIVSAPKESTIELFIEMVPDGTLSPRLHRLCVGDQVSLRPKAKGVFTLDEHFHTHLMVATVTGIAPSVSILRSYLLKSLHGHRFFVLDGASYQDELAYNAELRQMAKDLPSLLYVPSISRPTEARNRGWVHGTGRVHQWVEPILSRHGLKPEDTMVYACGHPGMVATIKSDLGAQGFKVKEERFWREHAEVKTPTA